MRGRSDTDWKFTFGPAGPGTKRPYKAKATLPIGSASDLDCIAAIWYRYKTLIITMSGNFSYSGSFEFLGDDWSLSLSGSYTMTSETSSGGTREGDRFIYPSGGGRTPSTLSFSGTAVLTNETTGDVWGTGEDPPRKLAFLGQTNGDVSLERGDNIVRLSVDDQTITTVLSGSGQLGCSCKSTTSDSPDISLIFFAQRFTSNEDNFYSSVGQCQVNLHNIYGSFLPIPVFNDPRSETPIIVFSSGPNSVELDGRASSNATLSISGGEVWSYGCDPDNPIAVTPLNALWSPSGIPTRPIEEILNASLTEA